MIFCLDTSALVDAEQSYYPSKYFPSFWSRLDELADEGRIIAPDLVKAELLRGSDALADWCQSHDRIFVPLSGIQSSMRHVMTRFVAHGGDATRVDPAAEADVWVIALAHDRAATVISHEKPHSDPRVPKIPRLCTCSGVPCGRLLNVIEQEQWSF